MCSPSRSHLRRLSLFGVCLALAALIIGGDAKAQSYTTARLADGFDYPVGKPDAKGYYVYRGYSPGGHLGEDWNGNGGGNTDEGDPVYATAHGVVVFSEDYRKGWGNVTIIRHAYRGKNGQIAFVDSLYGHLKARYARVGQQITRGEKIGTIGCGPYRMYAAHLHYEIRKDLRVGMRRDLYSKGYDTYHSPRYFMDSHRVLRNEDRTVRVPINTFLKSNPNVIRTDSFEIPEVKEGDTARPVVPEDIETIIEEETNSETVAPQKSRNMFEKLFEKITTPTGVNE